MSEKPAAEPANKAADKKSYMGRCMRCPLRTLRRIRDMYVSGMGGCAGAGGGGGRGASMTGPTAGMMAIIPRARSTGTFGQNSNRFGSDGDDDFRELVRVNSKQLDDATAIKSKPVVTVVPRSQSVAAAIGRIDEEGPCEFDDTDGVKLAIPTAAPYSRSRSCAVVPSGRVAFVNGVRKA